MTASSPGMIWPREVPQAGSQNKMWRQMWLLLGSYNKAAAGWHFGLFVRMVFNCFWFLIMTLKYTGHNNVFVLFALFVETHIHTDAHLIWRWADRATCCGWLGRSVPDQHPLTQQQGKKRRKLAERQAEERAHTANCLLGATGFIMPSPILANDEESLPHPADTRNIHPFFQQIFIECNINFLLLPLQVSTNLVASNNTILLFSVLWSPTKDSLGWNQLSRGLHSSLEPLEAKPFPCVFCLLEATNSLAGPLLTSTKPATAVWVCLMVPSFLFCVAWKGSQLLRTCVIRRGMPR